MAEEEAPNGFNDWEHLPSSSIPPPPETISDDPFLSIFPPVNHEGLPIPSLMADSHHHHPASTTTATSTTSSPSPPCSLPAVSITGDPTNRHHSLYWHSPSSISPVSRWIGFALHLLNSKVACFFSSVRSRGLKFSFSSEYSVSAGGVMTGASLMLLGLWIWWKRKRRRPRGDTIKRLNLLIIEKDEKIIELLNQVAELNKLLLARYRVPVMREC